MYFVNICRLLLATNCCFLLSGKADATTKLNSWDNSVMNIQENRLHRNSVHHQCLVIDKQVERNPLATLVEIFEVKMKQLSISGTNLTLLISTISLVTLVVLSTIYDVKSRDCEERNQNFLSFSLIKNGRNLLSMDQNNSDSITCLHGIRVLSIFSIMFFHSYFFRIFTPFHDEAIFNKWVKSRVASSISALNISVDSFLVMSAALTTRTILRELDLGKFSVMKTTFLRYMRLTPSVAFIVLCNRSLGLHLSKYAPQTFLDYSVRPCEKFWWSTFLYLQVYTNPREMCMHTTWYLSVEWQMTIFVAPILTYLLWKHGDCIVPWLYLLILGSCFYAFKAAYDGKFIARELDLEPSIMKDFYVQFYYPTHVRGAPFIIGIILGYFIHKRDRRSLVLNRTFNIFMWSFAYITISGPFSISLVYWFIGRSYFLNSLFLSTVRTLWGIAIAWFIYKSHNGEGGRTDSFLSSKYWMPLGKLGLSLYLVHPVLQYNFISSQKHQMDLEATCMLCNFFKDVMKAIVASLFLYFLVEEPFSIIVFSHKPCQKHQIGIEMILHVLRLNTQLQSMERES